MNYRAALTTAFAFLAIPAIAFPVHVAAQPGTVVMEQKISDEKGGFDGSLNVRNWFGWSAAGIGDLDGDGIPDIAVGAPLDDDGDGDDSGAVWILFLNADGSVSDHQKISDDSGRFDGDLDAGDEFGRSVAAIGDIDGDGIVDIAVGAPFDDDGVGEDRGAVWILFMKADGTVRDYKKLSASSGGFNGTLAVGDAFGWAASGVGDINGDEVPDIVVGAPFDDDGPGSDVGAIWVLFLKVDGKVLRHVKIANDTSGFGGSLGNADWFGAAVTSPGDLDGDGTNDLVVGAPLDNDGSGDDSGAVWTIFLTPEGKAKAHQKISRDKGNLQAGIQGGDLFGFSVGPIGDFDHDGVGDIVVGAPLDDDGSGDDSGAVYLLMLEETGFVKASQKISDAEGGFEGNNDERDSFGNAATGIGDIDGDGVTDLCVGAPFDNDGSGDDSGAAWILFLEGFPRLCGDADANGKVTSTDGLIGLNAAVGAADCELCVCDVDSSGAITASDALTVLNASIGLDVELACPVCP